MEDDEDVGMRNVISEGVFKSGFDITFESVENPSLDSHVSASMAVLDCRKMTSLSVNIHRPII